MTRPWRRLRGLLAAPAPPTADRRGVGWQRLPEPVPGHTTIDGVPVPVVAVRRNSETDELEVVRGFRSTSAWPSGVAPPDVKRHILPALSFIPHPRRELLIDGQQYFFGSVPNEVRCADCGGDHHGFGFVTSDDPAPEGRGMAVKHTALCEACAEKRAG